MADPNQVRWKKKRVEDEILKFLNIGDLETVKEFERDLLFKMYDLFPTEELLRIFRDTLPVIDFRNLVSFFKKKSEDSEFRIYNINIDNLPFISWEKEFIVTGRSLSNILEENNIEYNSGIQLICLLFIIRLKRYFLHFDLYQILGLDRDDLELQALLKRTRNRIFKNCLKVDSLILRALVSPTLEQLATFTLELEVIYILLDPQASSNINDLVNGIPEFMEIIRSYPTKMKFINPYGKNEGFDKDFKRILLSITELIYDYLSGKESLEKVTSLINIKLQSFLDNYSFFNERKDSNNYLFAQSIFNFINDAVSDNFPVNSEDTEITAIKILCSYFGTRNSKYSEEAKEQFIKDYYNQLKSGDAEITKISSELTPSDRSYYRTKFLVMLIVNNPTLSIKYNFLLRWHIKGNNVYFDLIHPNFRGGSIHLNINQISIKKLYEYNECILHKFREHKVFNTIKSRNLSLDINQVQQGYFRSNGPYYILNIDNTLEEFAEKQEYIMQILKKLAREAFSIKETQLGFKALYLLSVAKGEFVSYRDLAEQ